MTAATSTEKFLDFLGPKILNTPLDQLSRTRLHWFVRNDDLFVTRLLLERNVDVDAITDDNLTALHIAISNRSCAMVELLLSYQANVNPVKNIMGKTPLYMAVDYGCTQIVEMLLDKGAKLDDCKKVLHLAVSHGLYDIVELLIKKGSADIDYKINGKTALQVAMEHDDNDMVKLCLMLGASFEHLTNEKSTLMYNAVKAKNSVLVELLLKNGASVNDFICLDMRPLDVAVKVRCLSVTKLLLRYGALIHNNLSHEELSFAIKCACLLLAEGQKIYHENRKFIQSETRWTAFYRRCLDELKKSKTDKLGLDVTYFDMLSGNENSLASYAREKDVIRVFGCNAHCDKYQIYADVLDFNYAKGSLRDALLEKAMWIFNKDYGQTIDSVASVFYSMSTRDLMNFVKDFGEHKGSTEFLIEC